MFKYSKDGISVLSVLDARRAKKSGLFPVKIQVIYNRKQKYYSTGQELSKEDWANLAESKSRRLSEIRSSVENSFSIIKSQVESLAERGEFGFDLLSIRLGRCATVTVNAAVRAKIADAERNEQYSTRNGYHSMLLGIEAFAGKDIPFSTITIDWLNRLSAMEFAELIKGRVLNFTGRLFSSEHNRWFATDNTPLQILRDNDRRLTLTANRMPISQWFSEQYDKLRQSIRQPIQPKKSRGMKM